MFTLIAENKYGQQIQITQNDAYVVKSIDGLDPPESVINTTQNANDDGSVFNSSHVGNRTITITLAINSPAEANRINLYTYFKTKMPIRLYYTNDMRDVYIDGYVRNMTIGFFEKKQVAQIVIVCPKPFFCSAEDEVVDFSTVENLFEFPFAIEAAGIEFSSLNENAEVNIYNSGDVETGALFTLTATGAVVNPSIYNTETGEYFSLVVSMDEGDVIQINTRRKEKSVVMISGGVTTNIIGDLKEGSTWLQLNPADNIFTVSADTTPENMIATCTITDLFEGV